MSKTKKKSEKRQRTNLKAFRLNDEELAVLMKNVEASNLSIGDFIRKKCCDAKPLRMTKARRLDQKVTAQLLAAIMQTQYRMARLDNNVNQMAKVLNMAVGHKTDTEILRIFDRNEPVLLELLVLYKEYVDMAHACRDMLRQTFHQ